MRSELGTKEQMIKQICRVCPDSNENRRERMGWGLLCRKLERSSGQEDSKHKTWGKNSMCMWGHLGKGYLLCSTFPVPRQCSSLSWERHLNCIE